MYHFSMYELQEGSPECTPDSDMSIDDVHKKGKEALQSPLYLESKFSVAFSMIFSLPCGFGIQVREKLLILSKL